jgi:hypothetical protein
MIKEKKNIQAAPCAKYEGTVLSGSKYKFLRKHNLVQYARRRVVLFSNYACVLNK